MGQLHRIAVVEPDASERARLAELLRSAGHRADEFATAADALAATGEPADLVVASDGAVGIEVLKTFRARSPETPVILRALHASIAAAVEAIRAGAFEYLTATAAAEDVIRAVGNALRQRRLLTENQALRRGLADRSRLDGVVGRSEGMLEVFKRAARVATSDTPVLLVGEPGTGRELVARAIHAGSPRAERAFVPVDCASLPDAALEAELLGQAATGTRAGRPGVADAARAGTLYLESISRLGPPVQASLLRALEDGVLRRPGTIEDVEADFRLVASTDEDLHARARAGRFREDLLLRIEAVTIRIPPLRERREDIPLLAAHFAAKLSRNGRGEVAPSALHALMAYSWPGNVRELETAIGRALALSASDLVAPENLPGAVTGTRTPVTMIRLPDGARPTLADMERRYAAEILADVGGNKTRAAEILGIDRKTLYRLIGESGNGDPMTPTPAPRTPPPRRSR
jgi:DNA-binding NtrC family response regulator